MTPLHTQAARITTEVIRLSWESKLKGLPSNAIADVVTDKVAKMLQEYQDELLESQRQAALALDEALGRK